MSLLVLLFKEERKLTAELILYQQAQGMQSHSGRWDRQEYSRSAGRLIPSGF